MRSNLWLLIFILLLGTSVVYATEGRFLDRPLSGTAMKLTYRTEGNRTQGTETRESVPYEGQEALLIHQQGSGIESELYIKKDSMAPLFFKLNELNNGKKNHVEARFFNQEIQLTIENGERIVKKVIPKKADETIYPVDQFGLLLCNMNYIEGKPVRFKGLFYQYPYISDMVFKLEGKESIRVAAGTLEAYKVCLTLPGLSSVFFKANFWVSVDEPHYLLKYQGKRHSRNVVTELVKADFE